MPLDPTPVAIDNEFVITSVAGNLAADLEKPSVAALSDDHFVVVWSANNSMFGQVFDGTGTATGAPMTLAVALFNGSAAAEVGYNNPSVVGLGTNFAVTWDGAVADPTNVFGWTYGIASANYHENGQPYAKAVVTNYDGGENLFSKTTVLTNGGVVVTWVSQNQDGSGDGIFAQRFDPTSGLPIGPVFRINSTTAGNQDDPSIAALSDGSFLVAWDGPDSANPGNNSVFAARFSATGQPLTGEFRVNTTTGFDEVGPSAAALAGGGFVIVWSSRNVVGSVLGQAYDAAGRATGAEIHVADFSTFTQAADPAVTALADGGFVVTWESVGSAGFVNILGQRFDALGGALGSAFQINQVGDANKFAGDRTVVALPDGDFAVVWGTTTGTSHAIGFDQDIRARVFTVGQRIVPAVIGIVATDATKNEGNSGPTPFTFTVTRSGNLTGTFSATWSVSGTSATPANAADFVGGVLPSGTITFAPNETSKTITVQVQGDTVFEPNESFLVALSNPSFGASIDPQHPSAIGQILNDDPPPPAVLAITAFSAIKGDGTGGPIPFVFTITRTGNETGTSTVYWSVSGAKNPAATPADFVGGQFPSGMFTIGPGQSGGQFVVNVQPDDLPEIGTGENFAVTLSNPTGAIIDPANASAVGSILNDDTLTGPVVSITAVHADRNEGSSGTTPLTFAVTLTSPATPTLDTNVTWSVGPSGGTPADATDFLGGVFPSGTVTFPGTGVGGVTVGPVGGTGSGFFSATQIVTVNVNGDADFENGGLPEQFVVSLGGPAGTRGSGLYTIDPLAGSAIGTIREFGTPPVMKEVSFTAVESKTKDTITGVLFDNTDRYGIGSTVVTGPDEAGGTWTYTVAGITDADSAHQNAAYSGFVYDLAYFDADFNITAATAFGSKGLLTGIDDRTVNYSGSNYLGSDGDLVTINGTADPIASGIHVVPDLATRQMQQVTFQAVESLTGDRINGVVFDNTGKYTIGSSISEGPDDAGGTWTYFVNGITAADAVHQNPFYAGFVYDTSYVDADLGITANTLFGSVGLATRVNDRTANYSGSNYLGSDGDAVVINGQTFVIGSGRHVVPDLPPMQAVSFQAVESVTGDRINGVLFDNTKKYSVGSSVTTGTDNAGGTWTYFVNDIRAADTLHQNPAFSGFVYDTSYLDADLGKTVSTLFGAAGLATGDHSVNYSGSNYLGSDGDVVVINNKSFPVGSGKYAVPDVVVASVGMKAVSFTATESATGDKINGVLFDNTGKYTVGSSVSEGPDNAGGTWTYTVTAITDADAVHQNAAFSGFVYDTSYVDADVGKTVSTLFGAAGLPTGDRTTNYSGSNYLGSDGDVVSINGKTFAIGSGKYVVPDQVVAPVGMKADAFVATESVTGDKINGVLFDNTGKYTVGSSVSEGPDNAGGSWTYTVTSITDADAAHQNAAFSGFVYDTSYIDADLGKTVSTVYGAAGLGTGDRTTNYSGSNYLGSDGDVVVVNGQTFAIGSGKYVVADQAVTSVGMKAVSFTATESVTHDQIIGVLFDNTGKYTVGSSVTEGPDNAGGSWTYTVTAIANADAVHQNAAFSGFVYDTSYVDRSTTVSTVYGAAGLGTGDRTTNYSGSNYLGSDGDVVVINGTTFAIGSGKYVVPDAPTVHPNTVAPTGTLGFSAAGAPAAAGGGDSANLSLLNNLAAASFVAPSAMTGTAGAEQGTSAPSTLLTLPHA